MKNDNKLTYRKLLEMLKQIPEEHLDDNPAVCLMETDEVIPIFDFVKEWVPEELDDEGLPTGDYSAFCLDKVDGTLDEGHPYFTVNF